MSEDGKRPRDDWQQVDHTRHHGGGRGRGRGGSGSYTHNSNSHYGHHHNQHSGHNSNNAGHRGGAAGRPLRTGRTKTDDSVLTFSQGEVVAAPAAPGEDPRAAAEAKYSLSWDRQQRPHVIFNIPVAQNFRGVETPGLTRDWVQNNRITLLTVPPTFFGRVLKTLINELTSLQALIPAPLQMEIHTGKWATSHSFHCHVVCPLAPYYEARLKYFTDMAAKNPASVAKLQDECTAAYTAQRKEFVEGQRAEHAQYKLEDIQLIDAALETTTSHQCLPGEWQPAAVGGGVKFTLDPELNGCAVVQLQWDLPFSDMSIEQLTSASQTLASLLTTLGLTDSHIRMTLGGDVRASVKPDVFVTLLHADARRPWRERWLAGNPQRDALRLDMNEL